MREATELIEHLKIMIPDLNNTNDIDSILDEIVTHIEELEGFVWNIQRAHRYLFADGHKTNFTLAGSIRNAIAYLEGQRAKIRH